MQSPSDETLAPEGEKAAPTVLGYLESIERFAARGWAHDEARSADRLAIDIVDEHGRVVAHGRADIFRGDLRDAGLADGNCAFLIALPASMADGALHRLRALVADTGEAIHGELTLQQATTVAGEIFGLDGRFVTGWARDWAAPEIPVTVELTDGERVLCTGIAGREEEGEGRAYRLRLPLPDDLLDGRPHAFGLRVAGSGVGIAGAALVTPAVIPSSEAFRRSAAGTAQTWLDARAPYRYVSLHRQLGSLLDAGTRATDWADRLSMVQVAHGAVARGFERRRSDEELARLEFPRVDSPKVSVVIPVHDQLPVTLHCLASLLLAPNHATFEVIVVDDGSIDDTRELESLVSGIGYVRNETARGFVRASNLGASRALGEYVVMLNNDCEVTAGWLDALLDVFDRFDAVGLVGAKLLYPDGRLQEAGGIVWGDGDAWNYGRAGNASDPKYNYVRQVDFVSGACLMLPKALWDEVGGFDEHFAPAYYEDTDLAFRVRSKGLKIVYTPFSEVFHFEGLSSGTSLSSGVKRFQKVNEPKFRERWADVYRTHAQLGREDVDLTKDRMVSLRALVVDAETPQPDRDAGSYAIVEEILLLQSLGFKVTFVPENAAHLGAYTEALQRMGVECLFAPFVESPCEVIRKRGRDFDLVYVARYYVASTLIDVARQFAPRARVVLNNIDLHFLREMRFARSSGDPEDLQRAFRTRSDELEIMGKVDLVLSYNEVEHAIIFSHSPDTTRVALCPWVVSLPERVVGLAERADVAFLGGFQHFPNVEAVEYFVREVMPALRQRVPGVRFLVYGSAMPAGIRDLASEDVIIKGYVPSVDHVYDSCRVFVAPLLSGAGMKGKVIGAFAHGVPCVLSPVATEGIKVRDGEEAFVANRPEAWAEAIASLCGDDARWTAMSRAARAYAGKQHSFERGKEVMASSLRAAGLFIPSISSSLQAK